MKNIYTTFLFIFVLATLVFASLNFIALNELKTPINELKTPINELKTSLEKNKKINGGPTGSRSGAFYIFNKSDFDISGVEIGFADGSIKKIEHDFKEFRRQVLPGDFHSSMIVTKVRIYVEKDTNDYTLPIVDDTVNGAIVGKKGKEIQIGKTSQNIPVLARPIVVDIEPKVNAKNYYIAGIEISDKADFGYIK